MSEVGEMTLTPLATTGICFGGNTVVLPELLVDAPHQ